VLRKKKGGLARRECVRGVEKQRDTVENEA